MLKLIPLTEAVPLRPTPIIVVATITTGNVPIPSGVVSASQLFFGQLVAGLLWLPPQLPTPHRTHQPQPTATLGLPPLPNFGDGNYLPYNARILAMSASKCLLAGPCYLSCPPTGAVSNESSRPNCEKVGLFWFADKVTGLELLHKTM